MLLGRGVTLALRGVGAGFPVETGQHTEEHSSIAK